MSFTKNDICKVDLNWQVGSIGIACNIFQALLQQETAHELSDVNTVTDMAAWITRIISPMEPWVVVSVDITGIDVYKRVGTKYNYVSSAPIVFVPEDTSDPLPSGVATLITAYTDTSRVQGKKYFPGQGEIAQAGGLWVAGVLAALADCADEWVHHFASLADPLSEWYPGVWSLKGSGFRVFNALTAVRDVAAYQRRRKQGVGA